MVRQVGMYLFWTSLNPSSGLLQPSFPVVCLPELQCVHMYLYDGLSKYYVYKYTNMLLALFVHTVYLLWEQIRKNTVWICLNDIVYIYIMQSIDTATVCMLDAYIRIDDSQISWYPQDPTFFKTWVCVIILYYFVCVDLRSSTVRTSGDHWEPEPADAAGAERTRRSAHLGGRAARGCGWDNLQPTAVAAVQARVSAHVDACGTWTWKVIAKVLPV